MVYPCARSVRAAILSFLVPVCGLLPFSTAQAGVTVLYDGSPTDGGSFFSPVLLDPNGAIYATTTNPGSNFYGTVLELTPPSGGKKAWKVTVLHKFHGFSVGDGATPQGGLVADKEGALYGTTTSGGANNQGVVFKLTPPAKGKTVWTESILYSFGANSKDASQSRASLVFDSKGALYGTTTSGGGSALCGETGCGTVFKLTSPTGSQTKWTETVLHRFGASKDDGQLPEAPVILDAKGNVFGTTGNGGKAGQGTAFELTRPPSGQTKWEETILNNFGGGVDGDDGGPVGGLVMDKSGALYGTAAEGGTGFGSVFKIVPPKSGTKWTTTTIYPFQTFDDGNQPEAGLIIDKSGTLYGTASAGGTTPPEGRLADGCIFSVTADGDETLLFTFTGTTTSAKSGATPWAPLVADGHGNLFGTTRVGGSNQLGTIFELTGSGFDPIP
jgi:uncharacterized repeat protein (TIGR03803 family)